MCKSGILPAMLLCVFSYNVKAQNRELGGDENPVFSGYVKFEAGDQRSFGDWEQVLRAHLQLDARTTWKIYSELKDELGQVHYRAQQYFNNVPLENGVVVVHTFQNKIIAFNGEIIAPSKLSGAIVLSPDAAIARALANYPSAKYYWQDESQNQMLREASGNADTSYYPNPKPVYCPRDLYFKNDHKLCYKLEIYSQEPLFGIAVFVDAESGEIIATENRIVDADVKGTAVTAFSGTKPITVDSTGPGSYRLREKARGKGIETYNMKNGTSYAASVDFTDADNYWNNVNLAKDEYATDAHWGAEKTYDYYDSVLGRNSFDGNGAKIISFVHYSTNYSNAFWNGSYMTYGDGNGSTWKPLTSIDVCGHEISHAVTTYTAGLVYSYESGALNESFSDIFGNAIEMWARPNKHNWKIGEDFTTSGTGIRDMANPNPYNNPKYYKGSKWYAGPGDNGGVHTNSGVQNYWFYLLTEGVSGTNEVGNIFNIDSLGVYESSKIAYRNLSVYLTKNSQYSDARTYSIISAADLFGRCSKQEIAVTNAWWVCGVGAKYDSGYVKAKFTGDTFVCTTSKTVNFTNLCENASSFQWYFGDGNTSTTANPSHNYSGYGNFDVKLVAKSCFLNKYDSSTRFAYVVVDSTKDICNAALMPASGTDSIVKCFGFIYDDGGEGEYGALRQTNLKVSVPGATSIRFRFLYMDYENGYDSLVLFKTSTAQINKIGQFTGQTTPFGGSWQVVTANSLWLRHYSDPYVEGKGFKIEFEGIRSTVLVDLGSDTTICYGDSLIIDPMVSGGYAPDYRYIWSDGSSSKVLRSLPLVNTKYKLKLRDACMNQYFEDSMNVSVRIPLGITMGKDTVVCSGNPVTLKAVPAGGLSSAYNFTWDNSLGGTATHIVTPLVTTTYRVILSDGCTDKSDTAYKTIYVKPTLRLSVSASDTVVCIGQKVDLFASASGGDTAKYNVIWNNALGSGFNKSLNVMDTSIFIATLSDACSKVNASDTLQIFTYPQLELNVNADTIICRGTTIDIFSNASGGTGTAYSYAWSNGKSSADIQEIPTTPGFYKVTLSDGCSPITKDSIYVDLMAPLNLSTVSNSTLCDGQTLPVNLIATGGRSSTYNLAWNQPLSGFNVNLDPPTGVTQYRAILSDGCTVVNDTTSFQITKLAPLAAGITLTPNSVCPGDSAKMDFVFSGGKPADYSWSLNGIPVLFTTQKIGPTIAQNFNLVLTDGCSIDATAAANISIYSAPSVSLSALPVTACHGQSVDFKYNSPDAAEVKWYFSNGDSAIGTGSDLVKIFAMPGNFTARVKVKTSNNCVGYFDLSDTVKIIAMPNAAISALPGVTNIENPIIAFRDLSSGGEQYYWDFGDGNTSSFPGDQSHEYSDTGWFRTILRLVTGPGCTDSTEILVRVKDVYKSYIPTAFTPDENNTNDRFVPVFRGVKTFRMQIYNRWGMKVFESDDMAKTWDGKDADGTSWAPGTYIILVKIMDVDDVTHTEKGTVNILR